MIDLAVASVSAVAPTIAALAAWWHARGANRATNAVAKGEPTLSERVEGLETTMRQHCEDYRTDARRLVDQHAEIQHELGRLSGFVESLSS